MNVQMTSIASSNSMVRQRSVQNATGNALINTALNQMANETAVIIGNSTDLNQTSEQSFLNINITAANTSQMQSSNLHLLVL